MKFIEKTKKSTDFENVEFKSKKRNKNIKKILLTAMAFAFAISLSACKKSSENQKIVGGNRKIIATGTMHRDLVKQIAGEGFDVEGLMKEGVDPHLYKPTARDVEKLEQANAVVVNGLHLEGQMGKVLESLEKQNKTVIVVSKDIKEENLLPWDPNDGGPHDPHIWFSIENWKTASKTIADGLKSLDAPKSKSIDENLEKYLKELDDLSAYIKNRIAEIPQEQRILVTAHDAFNYFAKEFGFKVEAIQGISTESEASAGDIKKLADFLVENKVKAVFIESSVPRKTIDALVEACKAKGHDVKIGGELLSDSLGDSDSDNTYIKMYKHNIDTIVDALK